TVSTSRQLLPKARDGGVRRRLQRRGVDGVHRDQVQLHPKAPEELRQALGMFRAVVDAGYQRVLDGDPATTRQRVGFQRRQQLGDGVTSVHRNNARTRLVVRRVQ